MTDGALLAISPFIGGDPVRLDPGVASSGHCLVRRDPAPVEEPGCLLAGGPRRGTPGQASRCGLAAGTVNALSCLAVAARVTARERMESNRLEVEVDRIVARALDEDVGDGDVTTLCTIAPDAPVTGRFLAKAPGVVAGLEVARAVFARLDSRVTLRPRIADGDAVEARTVLAEISGPGRAVLSGERVALNFLQRMSGIATLTRRFVEGVRGTRAVILDTRKTAPGLRALDKWAVRLGGGQNHRMGLYDMALIKDNHIAAVGSISEAVARVRAGDARRRRIEVEVTTLAELGEALALGVDRIMLDNMSPDRMREAVRITAGRIPLEASGGVRLDTVGAVAATGVDFISAGAITHSAGALDISLDLDTPAVSAAARATEAIHG